MKSILRTKLVINEGLPGAGSGSGGGSGGGSTVALEVSPNYAGNLTYDITTVGKTTADIVAVFVNEQVMISGPATVSTLNPTPVGDYSITSPNRITFAFTVKSTNIQILYK